MTGDDLADVAEYLNRLPFVTWDRFVQDGDEVAVYGWIDRADTRADFVTLTFDLDSGLGMGAPGFSTSSSERSLEIHRLLYAELDVDEGEHLDCQRVETVFGDRVQRKTSSSG